MEKNTLRDFTDVIDEYSEFMTDGLLASGNFDLDNYNPLESLENVPLGQKILKLGAALVEEPELLEHFGAPAFEKKINEQRTGLVKKTKAMISEMKKFFPGLEYSDIDFNLTEADCEKYGTTRKLVKEKFKFLEKEFKKQNTKVECYLEYTPLEEYMGDVIPDMCLSHIAKAKEVGLTNFEVVVPMSKTISKTLIEELPEKLPDPAIIARVGKMMVWITFYL